MQSAKRSRPSHPGVGCLWAIGCLLLTMASPDAEAASRTARARDARRACLKGEVDRGTELLTDLFLETKDATYIYNLGRCYEQNHRYEDAISRFREYLMKAPRLADDVRAETQRHIDACLGYLGKNQTSPTPLAPPAPSTSPANVSPPPAPAPEAAIAQPATRRESSTGSGLRVAGIATAAAGGAAVLAGVLLNLKVNSMASDLEAHYSSDTRSTQQGYKMLSQVGYGVGAAGILAGGVLYYLGWRKGHGTAVPVTLAPIITAGQLGATLGGSF